MGQTQDFPFDIEDIAELLHLRVRRRCADGVYTDCPLCGDNRGKMKLNYERNIWRCNYCGESGGMLMLYAKVHNISTSEAYREICDAIQNGISFSVMPPTSKKKKSEIPQSNRAENPVIHQTLTGLLGLLKLSERHREHLRTVRGLTDEQIDRLGYKTTPPFYMCRQLTDRLIAQGHTVEGVPGFYRKDGRWTVNFSTVTAGFLIPVRGIDGMIHGCQIRLDVPLKNPDDPPEKEGAKYIWLSSSSKPMGVTSGSPIHFVGNPFARVVYVTEGFLKADVSHCLSNHTFAATAGANNIQRPLYNKEGRCPCCRHKITFKSIGRAGFFHTQKVYFYLIQRCKDGVMIREFEGYRAYRKGEYMTPECYIHEIHRTICDKNAIPQRAYYWGIYKQKTYRWINGYINKGGWYTDYSGMVYGKTLPALSKHELKKTGLPEYIRGQKFVDPEEYLIAYEKRPYIEKFVKAGLSRLAKEYVKGRHKYGCDDVPLSIQENSLTKLLGIDGQELKRLRQNNGDSGFLNWLQYEKASGKEIPDRTISWLCEKKITPSDLKFIRGNMSISQIHNYIVRQMKQSRMSSHDVITTWADYLSMAKRLHMDTDSELVYRVRDLKRRHNELVQSCQKYGTSMTIRVGKILEEYPHIDEICQSLKEKYEYSDEEYMIVAPTCVEDIILEGNALTHCIANSDRYWDRIENRESYILFLRKSADPTKAFYTLEIEPDGTIRQKRSKLNEQYEDIKQATGFLLKWQQVVAKRLTDEDRSLAGQSRALRTEEFEQLRKDQVTVRTGTLSGKLLVDVLMGDLMENAA